MPTGIPATTIRHVHVPGTCLITRCVTKPLWENGICAYHLSVVCTACGDRVRVHSGTHPLICIPCADAEGRVYSTPRVLYGPDHEEAA